MWKFDCGNSPGFWSLHFAIFNRDLCKLGQNVPEFNFIEIKLLDLSGIEVDINRYVTSNSGVPY